MISGIACSNPAADPDLNPDLNPDTGEQNNPTPIEVVEEFRAALDALGAGEEYVLDRNLNLSAIEWEPIGTDENNAFQGIFNGNGHTIKGLNPADRRYTGLFGYTDGATIKDLTIDMQDFSVTNSNISNIGAVVGFAKNTLIENVHVSGKISVNKTALGDLGAGGIAGWTLGTTRIVNSSSRISIEAIHTNGSSQIGGIAGGNRGSIENCYAAGVHKGQQTTIGGIAGDNGFGGRIENCYAAGSISGTNNSMAGGITGWNSSFSSTSFGFIQNCYSTVSVKVAAEVGLEVYVGGIAGRNNPNAIIKNCVAINDSLEASFSSLYLGRITGQNWNSTGLDNNIALQNLPITVSNGPNSTPGTVGLNTEYGADKTALELQSRSAYDNLGWNFTAVWKMDPKKSPYPVLRWQ
ncbi:GLUG motif-containing protein [Breznakiella homolactica]|uniref:GLUG domain-containing protein n=1 Tax=Breznakiella homolactica TaxID=2798577 RepID=A0A7T7XKB4_9SPIR|nr:GLUG motif-containing protein [Breznakiella homolactica]QQO07753.1 hypothetical protein JFL75_12455 [Breznakiella homolactica]